LQAPQTDPTTINMILPRKADRANKTLAFDADGNPAIGISAADVANAVTYATNAANSATAAASSASSASSSATAASGSASTASTQASNASTSASNASNSASSASTSATNAAASASTATTQASNASTSATNAASSASAASTSASNAATSETNAAASASTASTQATNASNSATAASGSATSAASSAAAAASALDSFDDRYLGTKTSDPTLDNDGNALVAGALYFSTTQNVMKVYDGASWITATSAGATSLLRFRYVATSGQTTFSGADAAAATLTYTVNNIAVHRNGVTLDTSEYTASNGTSIVLTVAAGTGDIIDIIAFKSFTVADALSAVSGGTVNGAVTITGVTTVQAGTVSAPAITTTGDTNTGIYFPAADTIAFSEGGVEAMRLDSAGNMGLGVTPSAWGSTRKAFQVGTGASLIGSSTGTSFSEQGANVYLNSGSSEIYIGTDFASKYRQANSVHSWYQAASGTAGNAISFTQAMTLDASGNLGIGTSSPSARLSVSDTANPKINLLVGTNERAFISYTTATTTASFDSDADITLSPNNTEAVRVNANGNLLVGTASSIFTTTKLQVTSSTTQAVGLQQTGGAANACVTSWNTATSGTIYQISFADGASGLTRGSITTNGTGTTYGTLSDYRLKHDIQPMIGALAKVAQLKPVTYKWNADDSESQGFIAHELQAVVPECVTGEKDAVDAEGNPQYQGIDTSFLVATLTAAIQEQQALITTLTDRITVLESK
jgi:hypothetical protein